MKHIELIGIPGVGKTTTYQFLRTLNSDREKWICFEDLYRSKNPKCESLFDRAKYKLKKIVLPKAVPVFAIPHDKNVLDRFYKQNPALIDAFWENIANTRDVESRDRRFHSVKHVMKMLERIQFVRDTESSKCCILDEGLVHLINYFSPEATNVLAKEYIAEFLQQINLPNGVVYFDGDIETIVSRTVQRGQFISRDKGMTKEELTKAREKQRIDKQHCVDALKANNIPVLRLDAEESVTAKADKIKSFVRSLL